MPTLFPWHRHRHLCQQNNRVIAVVQLINKMGRMDDGGGRASCAGMHFTHQDMAVIGAFLSLLGPHIFESSMVQPKRKMNIMVGLEHVHFTA